MPAPSVPALPSSEDRGSSLDPRWYVLPGALLLYILRFGYDYGTSDQDEVIPYVLSLLRPDLFSSDWFVQAQLAEFNVRTPFVWLLRAPAEMLPVWLCALLLYIALWLLLAGATWSLADRLTGSRVAAALSVVLVLIVTPQWTLGGNDLAHSMLVPSMAGWALALWGVLWALRGRLLLAGFLVGSAIWMQALVGLQVAGILGIWLLVRRWRYIRNSDGDSSWGNVLIFATTILVVAGPVMALLASRQIGATAEAPSTPSLFFIMAEFRVPHHYLPSAFGWASYLKFGAVALLGGASLTWLHRKRQLRHRVFVASALGVVLMLCLLGTIFTEVTPWLFGTQLQLFKSTVVAKLLCLVGFSGAVVFLLPRVVQTKLDAVLQLGWSGVALALSLWALMITCMVWPGSPLFHLNGPGSRLHSPEGSLLTWVQEETPVDAHFAVPPSWSQFRSYGQRSITVNFKAIPYSEPLIRDWFDRLLRWSPTDVSQPLPRALQQHLDQAYATLPPSTLLQHVRTYDVDFVVRPLEAMSLPDPFERVFRNQAGVIYRVPSLTQLER